MISLNAVDKRFGKNHVLKSLNFEVGEGKVVSMLGPNGSGKSTLIKCILGLVRPQGGTITVNGISSKNEAARKDISYMPQVAQFAENINAIRLIDLMCDLRGEHPSYAHLVEYFELEEHMHKPLGQLSGGTRQKVSAVLAFLFDSPIIILDEPTVGLDPVARVNFKQLVLEEKKKGKTIFFTSHIMSDVEEVADEIAFLLEGQIVYHGHPQALLTDTEQPNLERAIASLLKSSQAS